MKKIILFFIIMINVCTLLSRVPADTNWRNIFENCIGVSPSPTCVLVDSSGIYLGGILNNGSGDTVRSIAKWDGSFWIRLSDSNGMDGVNGMIYCMAKEGNNLYIGGWFDSAGSVPARCIAKWDGNNWSSLGNGINGFVNSIAVRNGIIYATGQFDTAGNVRALNVAKWNGQNWSNLGNGIYGYWKDSNSDAAFGQAVFIADDGKVYIGGQFDSAGVISVNNIAVWEDSVWYSLGDGIKCDTNNFYQIGVVSAMAMIDTNLYVGGDFITAGSISANNIARWDGYEWSSLNNGLIDGTCRSLAVFEDDLYAGGNFQKADTIIAQGVALWRNDKWEPLGSGIPMGVNAISTYNNILIAVGDFYTAGDTVYTQYVAFWSEEPILKPIFFTDIENHYSISSIVYPNPSDKLVKLRYFADEDGYSIIKIFDNYGDLKEILFEGNIKSGEYELNWDTRNISSGIYYCQIINKRSNVIKKIIVRK